MRSFGGWRVKVIPCIIWLSVFFRLFPIKLSYMSLKRWIMEHTLSVLNPNNRMRRHRGRRASLCQVFMRICDKSCSQSPIGETLDVADKSPIIKNLFADQDSSLRSDRL